MKKFFSYAMTIAAAIALVSCGGEKKAEKAPAPEAPANEAVAETSVATTPTTTQQVEATPVAEPKEEEKPVSIQPEDVLLPSALKGKVKVINGEDDCIPVVLNEYDSPEITITFELIQTVKTAPLASSYGQLWLVGVAQDKAGRTIKDILPSYDEWRTEDSGGEYFKAFLESEPGETITLSFTGSNGLAWNEKDEDTIAEGMEKTKQAMAKVAKFKLRITN
jgi:hypothetical protein